MKDKNKIKDFIKTAEKKNKYSFRLDFKFLKTNKITERSDIVIRSAEGGHVLARLWRVGHSSF